MATLTIPALQRAYEKQQIVTSLQTIVTTGNAALKKMAADKGCIDDLHCTGVFEKRAEHQMLPMPKMLEMSWLSISM
ncbi:MAG: hypothetical protein MZV64_27310 [Ignavibacteriales bacterium]|nr:hypothetical protein [Ignavibacteriales bacterium]